MQNLTLFGLPWTNSDILLAPGFFVPPKLFKPPAAFLAFDDLYIMRTFLLDSDLDGAANALPGLTSDK